MPSKKRELLYPALLECCTYAPDTYWENIFQDIAYARCPYGSFISKDALCCSTKGKEFCHQLTSDSDPKERFDAIYKDLHENLGMMSRSERSRNREKFDNVERSLKSSRQSWSSIRKKNLKDLMIETYVVRMKKQHNLSAQQARKALSLIFVAMVFKVVTQKDIQYAEGKILDINGISFSDKDVILQRDIYEAARSFGPQLIVEKKLMTNHWEKYKRGIL